MKRVATHTRPDADAIASAWLAATYLFPRESVEVVFVPRERPVVPDGPADCVVDVTNTYDPDKLVFDHKPPAFDDRNTTCATKLVWEHLLALGRPVGHLRGLVAVVHEGDRSPPGKPSPSLAASRADGFHFRLKQARARGGGDSQLYQVMSVWLDWYGRAEKARVGPMRDTTPMGVGTKPAGIHAPEANAAVGNPGTTPATSGGAKPRPTPRTPPAVPAAVAPGPASSPPDDELRALEGLLLGHVRLCRAVGTPDAPAGTDPDDRVVALRKGIGDQLARSVPGSKAARFLRGLLVLVEVEADMPGHLEGRRREADGWMYRMSTAARTPGLKAKDRVAREFGVDGGALGPDLRLAEAVELIARNCGPGALALVLKPDSRLGVSEVLKIGRKGPERQKYEMGRAAVHAELPTKRHYEMGRPATGDWPMDTRDFAKVPGRIGRALGKVEGCVEAIPAILGRERPTREALAVIRLHLDGIVNFSGQLLRHVEGIGTGEPVKGEKVSEPGKVATRKIPRTLAQVSGGLDGAHYFVEKTARDVTRLPPALRPSPRRAAQVRRQLGELIGRTRTLTRIMEAGHQ